MQINAQLAEFHIRRRLGITIVSISQGKRLRCSSILEILEDIGEDVDFDTCETLIDDGILSSLDIIQLIGALNDEFDISIPATEIIPENFNSVDAMAAMVARLSEE